jgi:glycosyltransferase involved in cell wall biosynthesis
MRVTMLVRCLAMMRGGGETRHLAWARELTRLGIDVELVAGRPLFREPRYPVDVRDVVETRQALEVPETRGGPEASRGTGAPGALGETTVAMIRSPYGRDFVYRFQSRVGFGRLTMEALHLDEEWFCRAAWRRIAASSRKPDVVHAHALHQAARLRAEGIPVVINLPGEPNPRYRQDLARADALIGDGWAADRLPERLGLPVERIDKGVDAAFFKPDGPNLRARLGLADRPVIVSVARLVPIKNVRLVIEAVGTVRRRLPSVHLIVAGDGPQARALRARAEALGCSGAVTFAGSVAPVDMPAVYRTGDVFALSSHFDNSPNAVLEAMACGLPVVATDVGGVRALVSSSGGAVVPPGDAAAMSRALESYLMSPATARAAGARNRERAASDFSWRASALQLLNVYRRVIGARPGGSVVARPGLGPRELESEMQRSAAGR